MSEIDETAEEIPPERPEPIGQCKEVNASDTNEDESTVVAKVTTDGRERLDQASIDEIEAERQHSKCSIKRPPY